MKKTLIIAVLACVLVLAGCGKEKGTQSSKSDESVAAEAVQNKGIDKRETDESETESIPTKERVSRNAVSGANLTREDGSVSFVYIMADDSVVSENGENFGVIRREDNALVTGDGTYLGSLSPVELSPYRNSKVAVSLAERMDSRVGVMYRSMVSYMVGTLGFAAENIHMNDCGLDPDVQIEQIEVLLGNKPDVIIVAPCDVNNVSEITDMCSKKDVPVVYIMSEPDEAEEIRWKSEKIRACYAGPDGIRSGSDQGTIVATLHNKGDINEDGVVKYIMLQGDPNDPTGCARSEYSIRSLNENGVKTEMLLLQKADWERKKAKKVISDALEKFGDDAEVIFCGNDEMALGAAEAVEQAGRKCGKDIFIVGAVGSVEAMRAILDGKITGTVFDDYKAQAEWAGNRAASMLDGDDTETVFYTNPTKITAGNAAEMIEYCEK